MCTQGWSWRERRQVENRVDEFEIRIDFILILKEMIFIVPVIHSIL